MELLTFTVITTDPNEIVEKMHNRMPVIVPERDYDRWLKAPPDRLPVDLLRPFDADKMTAWEADRAVGNAKNDNPDLLRAPNVVEMRRPLTDEELYELEGMDVRGEFDPPPPRKKRTLKPENLKFDF
jgi:hypothetical protein